MSSDEKAVETLRVGLDGRAYDIIIGNGVLAEAGARIAPFLDRPRVLIITDDTVARHWLADLESSLDGAGIAHQSRLLPAGEQTKSFAYLEGLTEWLVAEGIDRHTMLVALGGGVIGDLVGFAAATVLRGIPFVQIPTTLLAQVDSSVGGKTGINISGGKTLVGAFHQPHLVLIDTAVLNTLPERQLRAGYAEVAKYGLIWDAEFFAWCEANGAALLAGDDAARAAAIKKSCSYKADVVVADEHERGARALLNLGHTFGHAFEAECGYSDKLLHGEAVAIGTLIAFDLSVRIGICPAADADRVRRHFTDLGLPTSLSGISQPSWTVDALLDHMGRDKKVEAGKMVFVLVRGIGDALITSDVDIDTVSAVLAEALG